MTAMPKPKFSDGERVLCFHGPLIYEAKALKNSLTKDKQVKYLIHYLGWNKNWDEWVLEDRVLKYNDANIQKQKEVSKQHASTSAKNKKATQKIKKPKATNARASKVKKPIATGDAVDEQKSRTVTPSLDVDEQSLIEDSPTTSISAASTSLSNELKRSASMAQHDLDCPDEAKKIKRRQSSMHAVHDSEIDPQNQTFDEQKVQVSQIKPPKLEVKLIIPEELKRWLIDDSDAVNRQQKLHAIPAEKTVYDICTDYKEFKTQKEQSEIIDRITSGLIEYFDVLLGGQLLYKFERHQYASVLEQFPGEPMSKLYGSFHLLRLFVRLGTLLTYNSLDEATLSSMMDHVHAFLDYLVENSGTLFSMQHFINVNSEYHRKAQ
ncbi:mortality factor 4-like protein 1 isoform X2 [Bradysia coprophila]|uniref:mortality factor 4-like protein 1 isoform X2 n=1 Tax=Bradysia coprophila TaxID=38358 RepID=UPI00187DA20A|nr:mortality factor 4-like protein 1 isoform X2 [Bradysia coprophila]